MIVLISIGLIVSFAILIYMGFQIVPHQEAWVVERLGRFSTVLEPGPHWVIPGIDKIAYRHSLKEEAMHVPEQVTVTQDNVSVTLDGLIYVKIDDPIAASYGVKDPFQALIQLVQTTMRSEVGKIPLDKTFEEREALNSKLLTAINSASRAWGIVCLRYEIKDIKMPDDVRKAMELQMTAERQKRARILESEGIRQSEINHSEGQSQAALNLAQMHRQRVVWESEAEQILKTNRAKGEAEAIALLAEASASGMITLARAFQTEGGQEAAHLQIAEKYIEAFRQIAKEGNTLLLPADLNHPGSFVSGILSIFEQISRKQGKVGSLHHLG
jgi:regulator of protease activity HflC (stomatin/prohibitin superfamily)